ncbi:MAG: HDIG domain-containing protein [Phycisphaerales bacterium]|nr:HDIG domain-containing protein [Phycisphaerales bacterium]
MAKEPAQNGGRTTPRRTRARRAETGEVVRGRVLDLLAAPSTSVGLGIALIFALVAALVTNWAWRQPLVAVGRVMNETRLVRVQLTLEDRAQTLQAKEAARSSTPRVYQVDLAAIEALVTSIETLPKVASSAATLDEVEKTYREQFGLTPEILAAVKGEVIDGEPTSAWKTKARALQRLLERRPMLDRQTWQRAVQEGAHTTIRLRDADRTVAEVFRGEVVNIEDRESLRGVAEILARDAGFTGLQRQAAVNRIAGLTRPTHLYDAAETAQDQNEAAAMVEPSVKISPVGQVIFQRGDVLTQGQSDLFAAELEAFASRAEGWKRLLRTMGLSASAITVTLALVGYVAIFCPRIRVNASRMTGIAVLLSVPLALACVVTATSPAIAAASATAPTLLVAILVTIGYDRRSALAFGLLHGLLVCVALRQSVGTLAVMITGIACIVWTLKEIRDRNTLFRMSVFTAAGVGGATGIVSLIERPMVDAVVSEVIVDCAIAGGGALLTGGLTLFVLPAIERAFNVTTGLTLIELRDPKQPLLKELQQRAPGTYNHSLTVASIAEAAAEAIGADSLLTYVGALYHDVGKMNKPEYFVENQAGGPNRHDKLSPAMSLLVVVGHVKDGMELAREYRIPRSLQHFIESHHGTTLVEYFFHRAKQQALAAAGGDADEAQMPNEFEYRYPGPRPRTREAAILMVCDATESAARAMSDPTPGKLDTLVRTIAEKRLADGQFDDCELTLKDLHAIVESISRTLAGMYHARVAYPGPPGEKRA